jgi:two-component system, NarL family, response regulator LiaR
MDKNEQIVYIADDHRLVAQGFASLLQELGYEKIRLFENGKDLYKAALNIKPNLIFLDIYMAEWDGLTTLKEIRKQFPVLTCIVISMMAEKKIVEKCIEEGANAFLHKSCDLREIENALLAVENKKTYITSKVLQSNLSKKSKQISSYELVEPITDREQEVLEKLCDGLSYEEVATDLHISKSTVETHKKHLLHKFGVNSVSKMIALAFKHNMI